MKRNEYESSQVINVFEALGFEVFPTSVESIVYFYHRDIPDEIIVDKTGATSVKGIFSAGDVTDLLGKQSIIAAGDGSRALLSAFAYITKGG